MIRLALIGGLTEVAAYMYVSNVSSSALDFWQQTHQAPPIMGKAYSEEQRERVRQLLESGKDEDAIEKETGVSDRTVRRWKSELESSEFDLADVIARLNPRR